MGLIYFLQFSLMSKLIENSWILIFASTFNLLWYTVLVEVYEKNLASHLHVVGKEGVFNLTAFRELWTFLINNTSKLTSDNFSKISCNVKSVTFSYYIKFIDLSYTLNISFIHPWFCNLTHWSFESIGSLAYLDGPNIGTFHCTILKHHIC